MRHTILLLSYILITFISFAENDKSLYAEGELHYIEENSRLPSTFEDIFPIKKKKKLDTDSVYHYLLQITDTDEYQSFYKLFYGKIGNNKILIFLKKAPDKEDEIYLCVNPFEKRYPSILLLWRHGKQGITNWFKIENDIIYTYALCHSADLDHIFKQLFIIKDSRLISIEQKDIEILRY